MPEIAGKRVACVWKHGLEKFGQEECALRHVREWVPAVELVGGRYVG